MTRVKLGLLTASIVFAGVVTAKDVSARTYKTSAIAEGIVSPWGMVQLANGDFLITERKGELFLVDAESGKKQSIANLPTIEANNQGGLLDLELHPDYASNGWLYFTFASPEGKGKGSNTALMRARLDGLKLVDKELLYKASPNSTKNRHFGSRIEFDRDGYLYFSIGDRADRDENPQDITRDGGKIYRLHDDGKIPSDNPFVDHKGARQAIYSYGHRNPQGMEMHPVTGQIWTHEHGPRGGDELNIIQKGANFGWPVVSYGINYSGSKFTELTEKEGMVQPAWYWVPSIAPSGMTFVTSDKYPQWKDHLLVGSLKFNYLVLLKLDGNKVVSQETVMEDIGRVRNVKQMKDGYIYVATEGNDVVRIEPKK